MSHRRDDPTDEELVASVACYDETLSEPDVEREAALIELRQRLATLRAAEDTLKAENARLLAQVSALLTPDNLGTGADEMVYSPDDLDPLAEDMRLRPGQFKRCAWASHNLDQPPFVVWAVLSRDEAGDPDDTELRLVATEAEARALAGGKGEG